VITTESRKEQRMDDGLGNLDDLVLQLKGLVLVRSYREYQGADARELAMFSAEIEHLRDRLPAVGDLEGSQR
jgi:hypothetical protein